MLNGTKAWITNGGIANVHVVVAAVEPVAEGSRAGLASWCRRERPAFRRGKSTRSTAFARRHTAEVVLDDVRVPGRCLLGGKDKLDAKLARAREAQHSTGEKQPAMRTFEATRPTVGAQALGIARAAYEYSHWSTRRSARRSVARSS